MRVNARAARYLSLFIDQLYSSGVHHVVISPGSRSTPLALTIAEHGALRPWIHVDERAAGFFALGMAKASASPVALLCTSGSAAANYYPAVVEAFYGRVPLIILTADRPHELRDVGAPQTIKQIHMYSHHIKMFVEMAVPEEDPALLSYVQTTASRAVAVASTPPSGPVHLNFPFREPLIPDPSVLVRWKSGEKKGGAPSNSCEEELKGLSLRRKLSVRRGSLVVEQSELESLAQRLFSAPRGLIVCGPLSTSFVPKSLLNLSEKLGYPILADPLSNLRGGVRGSVPIIDAYDAFLRSPSVQQHLQPELILRFGDMPVSKPLSHFLDQQRMCYHVIVDEGEPSDWRDPIHVSTEIIYADPEWLCKNLLETIGQKGKTMAGSRTRTLWMSRWQKINGQVRKVIEEEINQFGELFEGRIFSELAKLLPDGSLLYLGNSMPIRDADTFFPAVRKNIQFLGNRGANGIDGLVSSALGASSLRKGPVVLVLGDLSFFHDLNGLLPAKLYNLDLTIVLINNDGGGIFSFLPQAEYPRHFETLFGTPIGLDYHHIADLYHASYHRINAWTAFRKAFKRAVERKGVDIIEVPTNRQTNVQMHRQIWDRVEAAVSQLIKEPLS